MADIGRNISSAPPKTAARNTLAREGIKPATASSITGSKFGRASAAPHKARDQHSLQPQPEFIPDRRSSIGASRAPAIVDEGTSSAQFLTRAQWIPLGDGWHQATPVGTGSTTRCGLHSVVQSSFGQSYICLYEPRTKEGMAACCSHTPEYDLEVHSKMQTRPSTGGMRINSPGSFEIAFAFKTATDYYSVRCDGLSKSWMILRCFGDSETCIAQSYSDVIKPNIFLSMLLQVRGNSVSLDVNGLPVFTRVRVHDSDSLSGLMGFIAKGSIFAVKGWTLRGLNVGSNVFRSIIDTRESYAAAGYGHGHGHGHGYGTTGHNNNSNSGNSRGGGGGGSRIIGSGGSSGGNSSQYTNSAIASSYSNGAAAATMNATSSKSPIKAKPQSLAEAMSAKKRGASSAASSSSSSSTTTTPVRAAAPLSNNYNTGGDAAIEEAGEETAEEAEVAVESAESLRAIKMDKMLSDCTSQLLHSHDKHIVDTVMRDAVQRNLGVTFDDIASLDTAKRLLNEAVVLPLIMPEFFTGIREPWKGVLLFGPPGTGKTLLAKAVCSFNSSTFFSCSSSSLISKYRGESEKIVRCLFEAARICAPSIIFLDEVDALVSARGDNEHEASRRLKTEFFSQMDGLSSTKAADDPVSKSVMVLATTNCPWDLDDAMRRRLEKRIYIPLPDKEARIQLFHICLKKIPVSDDVSPEKLAEITDGFSGSDILICCRDASMMPMRRLLGMLSPADIAQMRAEGSLTIPKVMMEDFRGAISNTKPSVAQETCVRYEAWDAEFSNN